MNNIIFSLTSNVYWRPTFAVNLWSYCVYFPRRHRINIINLSFFLAGCLPFTVPRCDYHCRHEAGLRIYTESECCVSGGHWQGLACGRASKTPAAQDTRRRPDQIRTLRWFGNIDQEFAPTLPRSISVWKWKCFWENNLHLIGSSSKEFSQLKSSLQVNHESNGENTSFQLKKIQRQAGCQANGGDFREDKWRKGQMGRKVLGVTY